MRKFENKEYNAWSSSMHQHEVAWKLEDSEGEYGQEKRRLDLQC